MEVLANVQAWSKLLGGKEVQQKDIIPFPDLDNDVNSLTKYVNFKGLKISKKTIKTLKALSTDGYLPTLFFRALVKTKLIDLLKD